MSKILETVEELSDKSVLAREVKRAFGENRCVEVSGRAIEFIVECVPSSDHCLCVAVVARVLLHTQQTLSGRVHQAIHSLSTQFRHEKNDTIVEFGLVLNGEQVTCSTIFLSWQHALGSFKKEAVEILVSC
jgi:hypothetical protein